jgi:hypothetical protein
MFDLTRAQQWIYQELRSSTALAQVVEARIYESPAPQVVTFPYDIIYHRAGTDESSGTGVRISTQLVFAIEVVTQTQSNLALEPAYDAIDDALQGRNDTFRGLIIDRCVRDTTYSDWGVESGTTRKHVGALWRLYCRPVVLEP